MIGQVITQTLGLSLLTSGASQQAPKINEVGSEEKDQTDHQTSAAKSPDVVISELGKELSLSIEENEPNWKLVQTMAAQLSSSMDSIFLKAGIDTSKPIRINIHPYTGIPFVGEHPDKGRIQRLLDDTPDLLRKIKNLNSVASYSYQISQSNHGLSSSAKMEQLVSLSNTGEINSNKLQAALDQYERTTQITRISMEYKADVGITLDVIGNNRPKR